MSALVDAVFQVVRDFRIPFTGTELWPADTLEMKRRTIALYFQHDLITLLTGPCGQLEGFLFFYRSHGFNGLSATDPRPRGPYLVCDFLWIREDLRNTGTLKKLIQKAVREQREKILGAEKLVIHDETDGFNELFFDFPKFFRKFI